MSESSIWSFLPHTFFKLVAFNGRRKYTQEPNQATQSNCGEINLYLRLQTLSGKERYCNTISSLQLGQNRFSWRRILFLSNLANYFWSIALLLCCWCEQTRACQCSLQNLLEDRLLWTKQSICFSGWRLGFLKVPCAPLPPQRQITESSEILRNMLSWKNCW